MSVFRDLDANKISQSEVVLREQYVSLRRQIPLMYSLMFINVAFLGLVTSRDGSLLVSLVVPVALSIIIAIRAG